MLAACGGWQRGLIVPQLEGAFASGDASRVEGGAGAIRWYGRGEGAARRGLGVGGLVLVGAHRLEDLDLGAAVVWAPPRAAREAGFQFRLGPRVAADRGRAGGFFAAEWAHWLIGSLYAEAGWDFVGGAGAFLFGARVNLLFPYTLVKVDPLLLD
jgi:hypothetical protein